MTVGLVIFFTGWLFAILFFFFYVRPTLSLSSTALGLLLVFHGPAYWYYTRFWVLRKGLFFSFYNEFNTAGTEASVEGSKAGQINDKLRVISSNYYDKILAAAENLETIQSLDIALGLTLFVFCTGIWAADKMLGHTRCVHGLAFREWRRKSFLPMKPNQSLLLVALAGVAIAFMIYFLIRDEQLSKVHHYFFTSASEFDKIAMRRSMGGSQSYLFNLMLSTLLPFVAFVLWTWWREGGGKGIGWLAAVVILLVIIAKSATLSKAPPAVFVLQLLVLEMARKSLSFDRRQLMALGIISILLFSAMTFVANSDLSGISESLTFLFYRLLMIPNESLLEYFAVFPSQLPYTIGLDIRWLAKLMGAEPLQSNFWRVAELLRGAPGSTTTAMFMADAWAAFSWAGVVGSSFLFGWLVRWIDIRLLVKRVRTCVTLAGLGLGHYGIFIAMSTALQTSLLTGGLLLVVPLVALLERQRSHQAPGSSS
jgi:hypothetical protein